MNINNLDTDENFSAIILAAGYSSRMTLGLKSLLPFALYKAMIFAPIEACLKSNVCNIFIVLGFEKDKISQAIIDEYYEEIQGEKLNINFVENKEYEKGMFTSVQCAFKALLSSNKNFSATFLMPVDAALIHFSTIQSMITAYKTSSTSKILLANFDGKDGHPPLIGYEHFKNICNYSGNNGLRGYFANLPGLDRISLHDEGILSDIDEEEGYYKALDFLDFTVNRELLSFKECLVLMKNENLATKTIKHSLRVGLAAFRLALLLDIPELKPQFSLIGGLLHDIKKKESDHPKKGEKLLFSLGYNSLACPIGTHMDLSQSFYKKLSLEYSDLFSFTTLLDDSPLNDISCFYACLCVFIADRFYAGNEFVSLEERTARVRQRFENDVEAIKALEMRTKAAKRVIEWFENKSNCQVYDIVNTPTFHPFEEECLKVFADYI